MSTWPGQDGWVSRDYGGEGKAINLTESRLGEFVYWVLRLGGHVYGIDAMATSPRAFCQASISLPPGKRKEFETMSGFALEAPPTIKLA